MDFLDVSILHWRKWRSESWLRTGGRPELWSVVSCALGSRALVPPDAAPSQRSLLPCTADAMAFVSCTPHAMPCSYARESNITLLGVELSNNTISRGSVIFLVSSELNTYQVKPAAFLRAHSLVEQKTQELPGAVQSTCPIKRIE